MGLIIPRSHAIHGTPPAFACTLCPAVFTVDERALYERHVLSHPLEEIQAECPEFQAPGLFGRTAGDQDWRAWVERHRAADPHGLDWDKWGLTGDGKNSSGLGDG